MLMCTLTCSRGHVLQAAAVQPGKEQVSTGSISKQHEACSGSATG